MCDLRSTCVHLSPLLLIDSKRLTFYVFFSFPPPRVRVTSYNIISGRFPPSEPPPYSPASPRHPCFHFYNVKPPVTHPPAGILPFLDVESVKDRGFRLARLTREDCCFMGPDCVVAKVKDLRTTRKIRYINPVQLQQQRTRF